MTGTTNAITVDAWMMTAQGEPLEKRSHPAGSPAPGDVLVKVAGCGVCHTDLSFLHQGVKTRMDPPLTLGHEISGTIVEAGEGVDSGLIGQPVVVPAVLPCGTCATCKRGRRRICASQIMPGNDRHGGFATHVTVPGRYVCPVKEEVLANHELWELAVVADAVSTPFQAVQRSGLESGDLAVFIGAGGIGIHGIQIAAATGAEVIALDVSTEKLEVASAHGAGAVIDVSGQGVKEVKARVKEEAKRLGAPRVCWKIFETSGTGAGQDTAFALLGFGATLAIVGFTLDKTTVRLSNLMAFDAEMFGVWGSDPEIYPEILEWIAEGRIAVRPFVERHPLEEINRVFDDAHHGKLTKRAVIVP